jgi:hypothetical protein
MKVHVRLLLVIAVLVVCGCVAPAAVLAFEVAPGSFKVNFSSYQAGAHADVTESFAFAQHGANGPVGGAVRGGELVFPSGFAGYPPAVKTCNPVQLQVGACPVGSQVGTIEVELRENPNLVAEPYDTYRGPLYNMIPSPNQTAVFGYVFLNVVGGTIVVSVGPDYRVHASSSNVVTGGTELVRVSYTEWGVPADPSHNAQRGFESTKFENEANHEVEEKCRRGCEERNGVEVDVGVAVNENPVPYLVNPSQCTSGPVQAELANLESWEGEKAPTVIAEVGPFTGCESLKFPPTIAVAPEESSVRTPTGYAIDLRVPQNEGAEGLGTADLKDAVVKLPEGVVLSPSSATGLVSCSEAQVGIGTRQPVECPQASKLGEVSLSTPALTSELKGALYLGGPSSGVITKPPFTVYLTLHGHGVLVKVRGTVMPDPVTGQLTTVFDENPQLPFSELRVQLNGGSRSTVANPSACGEYRAESVLTPWSSPFGEDATPGSFPFAVTGCGPARFDPSFVAGTESNQAGGYSPLVVTFSREDADQDLGGLSVTTPPGLLGNLSKVPLCGEPQAAEGTCPQSSQIGEVTAGAGPGPEPYFIKGGRVYLTGPYRGAPFGLSIAVPEKAGPIDLGTGSCDCEVVRAMVSVNPLTAQVTVKNSALPTIKDGIPFQVKKVNVDINRPEFIFNSTSCDPMSVQGTLTSTEGMSSQQGYRYQATDCAALGFKPGFAVSVSGKTSRANGASLTAKLTYPNVGGHSALASGLANIAKVKVDLPKQLPSRLTTLQKACTAATFEANPADCPVASIVGHAKAVTALVPVPLEGPAYFVSYGGAKFPELIIVLQGYGVTLDLHGETFISKAGITSSTFRTVPDDPIGSFELTLPQGPYSALAALGNPCKGTLTMPTEFLAQNGDAIHQQTKVAVTGCPKAKKATHKKKGKARAKQKARKASRRGGRTRGRGAGAGRR